MASEAEAGDEGRHRGEALASPRGCLDGEAMTRSELHAYLLALAVFCAAVGVVSVTAPGLDDGRVLVCVRKVNPTPDRYPRRAGTAAKSPL